MAVSVALQTASDLADGRVRIDTGRTFPDAVIPALAPAGLERVPGWRAKKGTDLSTLVTWQDVLAAEDPAWRADALAWQREVVAYREWVDAACRRDRRTAARHNRYAAEDPNYFKAMFCRIEEPRESTKRQNTVIPFVPYHFQVHLTNAWLERIDTPFDEDDADAPILDLWVPKSRGLGVTKNNLADKAWAFLYRPGFRAFVHGPKQDVVYKKGDRGALFSGIVFTLDHLPPYVVALQAPGYSSANTAWYKKNLLHNLVNGAQIVGNTNTDAAGRGDRFLEADPDEAGEYDNLEELLSSLRGAAKVVRLTGTEKLKNRQWLESWQWAKRAFPEHVFEINFHQNPRMDAGWVERERRRFASPDALATFNREYLRDPWAGHSQWVYPEARDLPDADLPYTPLLPLDITLDPAGTGDDVAFIAGQPTRLEGQDGFHTLFTYQARLPNPEWMAHLLTGIWPEKGDACYGQIPNPDERIIGDFLRERWLAGHRLRHFMDPAGDQHSTNTSYKKMVEKKTGELRARHVARLRAENERATASNQPEPYPTLPTVAKISPKCDMLKKHRLHADRQFAVRKYITHFTFQRAGYLGLSQLCSADWGRECLANHEYRALTPNMVTQPVVKHGTFSHVASCYEHYCIAYVYKFVDPPQRGSALEQASGVKLPAAPRPIPPRRPPPSRSLRPPPARRNPFQQESWR